MYIKQVFQAVVDKSDWFQGFVTGPTMRIRCEKAARMGLYLYGYKFSA